LFSGRIPRRIDDLTKGGNANTGGLWEAIWNIVTPGGLRIFGLKTSPIISIFLASAFASAVWRGFHSDDIACTMIAMKIWEVVTAIQSIIDTVASIPGG
jgi:hypothetical protein